MTYYLVPLAIVVFFGFYYVVVIPKLKQQSAEAMKEFRDNLGGKGAELRKKYLKDANALGLVSKVVGEEIVGMASALKRQSVIQVMGKKVSDRLKREFVMDLSDKDVLVYYLVLGQKSLHYLVFKNGEFETKESFELGRMQVVQSSNANVKDAMVMGGDINYKKISFTYDEKSYQFFYAKILNQYPNGQDVGELLTEWMVIFAEAFEGGIKGRLGA